MKSLLTALEEGRLVELPEGTKDEALEYLALLIEAIPDIGSAEDIVSGVKAREKVANSGLGNGVACPHVRVAREGDLLCAVGWSPSGIDYGAPDGKRVHLVIMYYIPDSQRNAYLKEVSGLAKAIKTTGGIDEIIAAADLNTVRHKLLDWVGIALDAAVPEAKARMIKLEAKQAMVASALTPPEAGKARPAFRLIPFTLLKLESGRDIVLSQDKELVDDLEKVPGLSDLIAQGSDLDLAGYRILLKSSSTFAANRQVLDCLAVRAS